MHKITGQCDCGKTQITAQLSKTPHEYTPRECDCDFCTTRNIAYISAPDGKTFINSAAGIKTLRQGSQQADFLACSECNMVVAATFKMSKQLLGAVNVKVFSNDVAFGPSETVSPQRLTAEEKKARWEKLWMKITLKEELS